MPEAALIVRQARARNLDLQLIAGDGIGNEDFGLIAGAASDGTLMTSVPPPSAGPEAAVLAERLDRPGIENAYAAYTAVQVWAQAVELAGTFETEAVTDALRSHEFDTVLGTIGFDAKGDVTGYDSFVWYEWQGGAYAPVEPGELTD